jgi:hypothetical protein
LLENNLRIGPYDWPAIKEQGMPKGKVVKGDSSWFVHDRFGLFIHWGLYAQAARHEWVKHNERITNEEYCTIPGSGRRWRRRRA